MEMIDIKSDSEGVVSVVLPTVVVQLAENRDLALGVGIGDSTFRTFVGKVEFEVFESQLNETRVLLLLDVVFVNWY